MVQVRIRLAIDARAARLALAAVLLCVASAELDSQTVETISASTYYPAPKGYYTSLTTAGQTYLGTGGGPVTIGSTSSGSAMFSVMNGNTLIGSGYPTAGVPNALLDVEGRENISQTVGNPAPWGVDWNSGSGFYGITREGGTWASPYPQMRVDMYSGLKLKASGWYGGVSFWESYYDSGMDSTASGGTGAGSEIARFRIKGYGDSFVNSRLALGGSGSANGQLDVQGDGIAVFRQAAASCRQVPYGMGGTTGCNPGEYATTTSGVLSRYGAGGPSGAGTMLCCTCPLNNSGAAACPTLPP